MKKELSKKEIEIKKVKSLEYSIKDGAAASIQSNIDATFIPQFALALKGSAFQVGLISAFAGILNPLTQLVGDKLIEYKSRKRILISFIIIQICLVLLIGSLALAIWNGMFNDYLIYILIILTTLVAMCSGIVYPAWFSLLGELVPKDKRGKFFSKRNIIVTIAGLIIIPLGIALDKLEIASYLMLGFFALFIISAIARTFSVYYLSKHYEPKLKLKKSDYFSLMDFIKRFDDVGKFAVYYALFNLAIMIASPFFAVYMKQILEFSYLEITIISLSSSIFYMLFSPLIGKISDKYGNVKLLYLSTILFAINPFLWAFMRSFWSIALIPQLVTGVANAAMAIAVTNFIYNMTKKEHSALCMSYLNILAGVGTFIGSILGGVIIKSIPSSFIVSPFIAIFIISGIARLIISVGLVRKLREAEDNVKPLPKTNIDIIHPVRTINSELSFLKRITH